MTIAGLNLPLTSFLAVSRIQAVGSNCNPYLVGQYLGLKVYPSKVSSFFLSPSLRPGRSDNIQY